MKKRIIAVTLTMLMLVATLAACGGSNNTSDSAAETAGTQASTSEKSETTADNASISQTSANAEDSSQAAYTGGYANGKLDTTDMFSSRDMKQEADTADAKTLTLADNKDTSITEEGVYVISGSANNASIIIDAADDAKVQLVLNNVNVTNSASPAIYVKNADKVFVTTADGSTNTLTVSGAFTADGDTNTDAVIYSKDDLVLNGSGALTISSTDNGISGKDDVKITGGTIDITATSDGIEANESIAMVGGSVTIKTDKDAFHAENNEDDATGYIYIGGGSINATAGSDGIRATTVLQIDNGDITVSGAEGLEATYIQINGGAVNVTATDDGINATGKSTAYSVTAEFNDGEINVDMGQGDTDAIDVNGDLIIAGGTFNINAQSPFDYDGSCEHTGGTIYVNGVETEDIANQMMGGGRGGDMGGRGGDTGAPNDNMGTPGGMN